MNGALYGLLFSIGSRAIQGEINLDESHRDRLEKTRDQLDDLTKLVGDLSPTEPGSWSRFAGRVMDRSFETRGRFESIRDARTSLGLTASIPVPGDLSSLLLPTGDGSIASDEIYRDDNEVLVALPISDGPPVALAQTQKSRDADALCFPPGRADSVRRALARLLWADRQSMSLDYAKGSPTFSAFDLQNHHYRGDRLELIDQWRQFLDQGLRRSVLLQGPPGTGKTTLCIHAARQLGQRVIYATGEVIAELSATEWHELFELLDPDVLIIDDLDRLDGRLGSTMENKLAYFEESHCSIPLLLFTSNDYTRIPPAMRRPGRIDQIVRFDEPDPEARRHIVEELATRENISIPDDQMPRLLDLLADYSPAHVVEALRRARIHGWSHSIEDDDSFRLQRDYRDLRDWLRINRFTGIDLQFRELFSSLCHRAPSELVYDSERNQLHRIQLPNGAQLCFETGNDGRIHGFYSRPSIDGQEGLEEGIAQLFWSDHRAFLCDEIGHGSYSFQGISLDDHDYYGPLTDSIDDWRDFASAGYRRNILLQGPPGCGKSTFCRHAARQLSQRTLILTPAYCEGLRCQTWHEVLRFLSPQMVIIDDVDRVSSGRLESNLRLFEEGFCDVPFIFFTTNDHTSLPRPMRRPGRIDQIIELQPPERQLRWQLIDEMAQREGLDNVPEAHLQHLDAILCDQSTAHLVEALRRARVLGWERAFDAPPGDTTFEDTEGKLPERALG